MRATHGDRVLPGVRVEGVALGGATRAEVRERLAAIVEAAAATPLTLVAEERRETLASARGRLLRRPRRDGRPRASRPAAAGRSAACGRRSPGLFVAARRAARADRRSRPARAHRGGDRRPARPARRFPASSSSSPERLRSRRSRRARAARSTGRGFSRAPGARRSCGARAGRVEVPLRTRRVATPRRRRRRRARGARLPRRAAAPDRRRRAARRSPPAGSPGCSRSSRATAARRCGSAPATSALATLVDEIAAKRDRPARSAQISAPDSGAKLDAKGDASWRPRAVKVTVTAPARSGRDDQAPRARRGDRGGDPPSSATRSAVPTERSEPAMTRADARDVRALIGTFTTYYVAGQPRVTNIQQIATDVDGTVVAPGARFSLNETAGERTEARRLRRGAVHRRRQDRAVDRRRRLAVLDDALQRRVLRRPAARRPPPAQLLHRSLSGRPRGDAELPRHRPDVDQRHRRARPHPHEDRRRRGHGPPLRRQRRAPRRARRPASASR